MFTRKSLVVRPFTHCSPTFGGKNDLVSFAFEPFTDDFFGPTDSIEPATNRIHVCGIKEVDPHFQRSIHDRKTGRLITLSAKCHCSQANLRDFQSRSSHTFSFHCSSS